MAGRGARFQTARHKAPKPFIQVFPNKRMVEVALSYLTPKEPHHFIFVCRKQHVKTYHLKQLFLANTKSSAIVTTDRVTEGPACSVLLANKWINTKNELLIAYCDDYLDIKLDRFLNLCRKQNADGALMLYRSRNPKNSFAIIDRYGKVLKTAEKKVISRYATAGLYYFKEGREFVRSARRMIWRNRRSKGEFFVCPVYNEMIEDGKKVLGYKFPSKANLEMGDPKSLKAFKRNARLQTGFLAV